MGVKKMKRMNLRMQFPLEFNGRRLSEPMTIKELTKAFNMKWYIDPHKYPYFRTDVFAFIYPNEKPIKKGDKDIFSGKDSDGNRISFETDLLLVGMSEAIRDSGRIKQRLYFWLKGYDKCMPDGKFGYDNDSDWFAPCEAFWIKGDDKK